MLIFQACLLLLIIDKIIVFDRSFAGNTKQKRSTTKKGSIKGKTRKGKINLKYSFLLILITFNALIFNSVSEKK